VIEPELVQNGRVQIVQMHFAGDGAEAKVISLTQGEAGLDAGGITGMSYNPLSGRYWLGSDTDVNYLMQAVKPA